MKTIARLMLIPLAVATAVTVARAEVRAQRADGVKQHDWQWVCGRVVAYKNYESKLRFGVSILPYASGEDYIPFRKYEHDLLGPTPPKSVKNAPLVDVILSVRGGRRDSPANGHVCEKTTGENYDYIEKMALESSRSEKPFCVEFWDDGGMRFAGALEDYEMWVEPDVAGTCG